MKARLYSVRACLLILAVLLCAACGGGGGGGGGTTNPSTGFSRADLAGNWAGYFTLQSGDVRQFTCSLTQEGTFTSWVFIINGVSTSVTMNGQLTVYSDGQINGVTSFLDGATPFAMNWSHVFFTAQDKVKGFWVLSPTEDQPSMVMNKQ